MNMNEIVIVYTDTLDNVLHELESNMQQQNKVTLELTHAIEDLFYKLENKFGYRKTIDDILKRPINKNR